MRDALAGVLCRCTGYRKIVEAVLAVAGGAVADAPAPRAGARGRQRAPRGSTRRPRSPAPSASAPTRCPRGARRLLTMRVVRSPHAARRVRGRRPRARSARRWPGVVDVVTAADVPNNAFAIFPDLRDQPVLADGVVRFRGEAVLALVGDAATVAGDRRRRAADPLHAAAPRPRRAPTRSPPPSAARRCTRAIPTTCCAAAASSAATSTRRSPRARASRRARAFETRHVEHAYIEPEAGYAEIVEAATRRRAAAPRPHLRLHADALHGPRRGRAACWRSRPSRCTSCRRRSAAASAASSTSRCSRCSRSPPGSSAAPVRLVYERPESMQSSTKRHPARDAARARRATATAGSSPSTSPATSTPAPTRRGGRRSPTGCRSTPAGRTACRTCAR